MGLDSRDWAREPDERLSIGAGDPVVQLVILANLVVFGIWFALGPVPLLADHLTVSPRGVLDHYRLHTLLTAGFSHAGFWVFVFNMFFLWGFWESLEETIRGTRGFLILYLGGTLAASATYVVLGRAMGVNDEDMGSSGAIMAVMAACAIPFPDRPVRFFGFEVAVKWLVVLFILFDLLPVFTGAPGSVAHVSHVAGAVWGGLFYYYGSVGGFRAPGRRGRAAAAAARPEVPADDRDLHRPPAGVDGETAGRVDALLAKIAREGMAALSEEEKAFLSNASGKYKGKSS